MFCCTICKSPCLFARTSHRLTAPIGSYVPIAIPRLDETICGGGGGISKNIGMVRRINSVQAARHHKAASPAAAALFRRSRRSDAENAQSGGEGKRDERLASNHDNLPFVCRGGCSAS